MGAKQIKLQIEGEERKKARKSGRKRRKESGPGTLSQLPRGNS